MATAVYRRSGRNIIYDFVEPGASKYKIVYAEERQLTRLLRGEKLLRWKNISNALLHKNINGEVAVLPSV